MNRTSIIIDGTVGAGKSTLMNFFEKNGYTAFPEPVLDNPLLDKFYRDRKKYSLALQEFFLERRSKHMESTLSFEKVVMDRSIFCDEIFARKLTDDGDMTIEQFQRYQELLSQKLTKSEPPTLMIYLQISVDEAMNRIRKRNRDYELIVERSYWEDLNFRYHQYFSTYNYSPLLVIDVTNLDFEGNNKDREQVFNLINEKLNELGRDKLEAFL